MNLFALASLCASSTCFALGLWVYSLNRKSILNKLFFLAGLVTLIYSFTTVMMWTASDGESAYFWHKMGTIWPFLVVLVVHFALIFTESDWLKKKRNYIVLYLPAIALWLIDLFTNLINDCPILKYWGYNDPASGTWVFGISTVWSALLPVFAFAICFKYYLRAKEPTEKQRRKYVAIGFAIPIAAFISTNMLGRAISIEIPNLGIFHIILQYFCWICNCQIRTVYF